MPHTARYVWGLCVLGSLSLSLSCYWPYQTVDGVGYTPNLFIWTGTCSCGKHTIEGRKKWMRPWYIAFLTIWEARNVNTLPSFPPFFCTVFFNPWKLLSCGLKWLAGIGVIRYNVYSQPIVPCRPVPVPRICYSNTKRKAANCEHHRSPSDTIRCCVSSFCFSVVHAAVFLARILHVFLVSHCKARVVCSVVTEFITTDVTRRSVPEDSGVRRVIFTCRRIL